MQNFNTLVLAICGERYVNGPTDSGYHIRRYAYSPNEVGSGKVRDAIYVNQLINRLTGGTGETSWVEGEPPVGMMRLFDVLVDVQNHKKTDARYKVDYRKYTGCPLAVVADGMEIYAAIRKFGVRPAMKQVEKNAEAQEKACEAAAEAARQKREADEKIPRFKAGATYRYSKTDLFGHVIERMALVTSVSEDRHYLRVRFNHSPKEKVALIRQYENRGDGEYAMVESTIVLARNMVCAEN